MADLYAKVVQGVVGGTPVPVSGGGAGGEVPVYSIAASRPVYAQQVDAAGNALNPPGSAPWLVSLLGLTVIGSEYVSADQPSQGARGLRVYFNVTNLVGTSPTVQLFVADKDPISGLYPNLLAGSVVSAASFNKYMIYPGITTVAGTDQNYPLPRTWRIDVITGGAVFTSATISVAYCLLP